MALVAALAAAAATAGPPPTLVRYSFIGKGPGWTASGEGMFRPGRKPFNDREEAYYGKGTGQATLRTSRGVIEIRFDSGYYSSEDSIAAVRAAGYVTSSTDPRCPVKLHGRKRYHAFILRNERTKPDTLDFDPLDGCLSLRYRWAGEREQISIRGSG